MTNASSLVGYAHSFNFWYVNNSCVRVVYEMSGLRRVDRVDPAFWWRHGKNRSVLNGAWGRFPFSQNFRNFRFGGKWNTRFVGSSHWKIPRKSWNLKRWSRFPGWNFRTECRVPFTFLVVCTSSRSTVGHRHVPGFTTKWNNFLPVGNSTFATTEISWFFPKWKAPWVKE